MRLTRVHRTSSFSLLFHGIFPHFFANPPSSSPQLKCLRCTRWNWVPSHWIAVNSVYANIKLYPAQDTPSYMRFSFRVSLSALLLAGENGENFSLRMAYTERDEYPPIKTGWVATSEPMASFGGNAFLREPLRENYSNENVRYLWFGYRTFISGYGSYLYQHIVSSDENTIQLILHLFLPVNDASRPRHRNAFSGPFWTSFRMTQNIWYIHGKY